MDEASTPRRDLRDFLRSEVVGGAVLLIAACIGLAWANIDPHGYEQVWHHSLSLSFGPITVDLDAQHWVNEGLMVVFFFLIGLEIKRELVLGELADRRAATLPVLAALGGVAVPALIYFTINAHDSVAAKGWAIPIATDVAFVLGALALLGSRVPPPLKLFLLTLAIVDDIIGIVVIAVFFSEGLQLGYAIGALGVVGVVIVLRRHIGRSLAYVPIGIALWYLTLRAGIQATIAGVVLGLLIPAHPINGRAVISELEHRLHPWSALLVVPLFAIANAGVSLHGFSAALSTSIASGVVVALVVGKPLGILAASWFGIRRGWCRMPSGLSWRALVGGSLLGGIGFTVSLFLVDLSLPHTQALEAKIGVLTGSLLAAAAGTAFIALRPGNRRGATTAEP